ncbi:MAG: GDP-L-fucose synthase [Candidatus Moanabacter tarae]|mgnify:CR=1 FL=1|uniref:GDP-L-fucose synthase n=1 Tax=Candidatus Moanibacter tarae TaxID=2200854 RepID=A0A2Z4ADS8_9BACT|nr:MAG: GDP-L-fucose synthase [Candidatus Moanabacter tarae]|tara:strand:- start:5300 stop:6250 length:951 start_codon:yes stop_codon:yes gene_type:complete
MEKEDRVYVAGSRGMVGSALMRKLIESGFKNLLTQTREELDLCDASAVNRFFEKEEPEIVIVAAAKVGGIQANATYPAEFLRVNLSIALNMVEAAYRYASKRLLFLGSSCIYPREATQPIVEESLLESPLEPTNEAYAIAKIAGLKLCQKYREQFGVLFHSAMPTNLYGPGDNYHLGNSHVIPALIRKFHEAKVRRDPSVVIWGTGRPKREFMHVDDLADAILHLLNLENPPDWINLGSGKDLSILELAKTIRKVVGYEGEIEFDTSKPDGPMRKLLDISRLKETGWFPKIGLEKGLTSTYADFVYELEKEVLRMV